MPACASESLSRLWQNGASIPAGLDSNFGSSSSTPSSSSPPSTSPIANLRRTRSVSPTSTFLKQESFKIKSKWRSTQALVQKSEEKSVLVTLIGWYPCFLLQILRAAITTLLPIALLQTIFSLPRLWFSIWLSVVYKLLDVPLSIFKWIIAFFHTPALEFSRKKRTVLISGGSTVQSLHLARNFYSAGARVVVCETEGGFALSKFSTSVSRFYTLPKPSPENTRAYVQKLCSIVEDEKAVYYVPVSCTTSAYYDALAKPMLELLGCTCICPGAKEVLLFDDPLQFLRKCEEMSFVTPVFFPIASKNELRTLYGDGMLRGKHLARSCGPLGARDRQQITLPENVNDLPTIPEVVADGAKPWVVIRDEPGDRYITCTTVKKSKLVANVSCKVDDKSLIPVEEGQIEEWIREFFERLQPIRPITGHLSFVFCVSQRDGGVVIPLACRVMVSLPYICHTSVHARLLWRPCKHFSRQQSGPLVAEKGRYMFPTALLGAVSETFKKPGLGPVSSLIGTVLDKREVIFAFWDPLPYCVYYHLQLPMRHLTRFLQRERFPDILPSAGTVL